MSDDETLPPNPNRQRALPANASVVFDLVCRSGSVRGMCFYSIAKIEQNGGERWFMLCLQHGTRLTLEAEIILGEPPHFTAPAARLRCTPFATVFLTDAHRTYAARRDRCGTFAEEAELNVAGIMLCPKCTGEANGPVDRLTKSSSS